VTPDAAAVAAYLDGVAADAADRPRSLAAGILARAVRRAPGSDAGGHLASVEADVRRIAADEAAPDAAAEVLYEIGSILVELRDRFPDATTPLQPLLGGGLSGE
jgi:hypothetical protein